MKAHSGGVILYQRLDFDHNVDKEEDTVIRKCESFEFF